MTTRPAKGELSDARSFRWGIVGPGEIADVFAGALRDAGAGSVALVLGRRAAPAAEFAARHGGRTVGTLGEVLSPGAVDGIYIATPHVAHGEAARAALEAGVPVLCEKPLTTDLGVTRSLVDLSRATGTPLMEAWMYRAHPQMHRLLEALAAGAIGELRSVQSTFSFGAPFDPEHRLFSPTLGGGAVWDVGGYPVSFALACARAASGAPPESVALVEASCRLGPSGVDHESSAVLAIGSVEAHVQVAIDGPERMEAVAVGSAGRAFLPEPFLPEGQRRGTRGSLVIENSEGTRTIDVPSPRCAYGAEALAFIKLVQSADPPAWPLVTHGESLAIAELLGDWLRVGRETTESRP